MKRTQAFSWVKRNTVHSLHEEWGKIVPPPRSGFSAQITSPSYRSPLKFASCFRPPRVYGSSSQFSHFSALLCRVRRCPNRCVCSRPSDYKKASLYYCRLRQNSPGRSWENDLSSTHEKSRFSEAKMISVLGRNERGEKVRDLCRELGISEGGFRRTAPPPLASALRAHQSLRALPLRRGARIGLDGALAALPAVQRAPKSPFWFRYYYYFVSAARPLRAEAQPPRSRCSKSKH